MIIGSIKTKLLTLDGDIRVISGHGPETSIAFEKKHNILLRWGQAMWVCPNYAPICEFVVILNIMNWNSNNSRVTLFSDKPI